MRRREAEISVAEYIARFRRAEDFAAACRACPGYGRTWACLPFDFEVEERLRRYGRLRLVAYTFEPAPEASVTGFDAIAPAREEMNREILVLERELGGLACAFGGSCRLCGECTRPAGLPCRRPEEMRPSLEAYGFDLGRTLGELMGIELEWGPHLREITLVGGVFYNEDGQAQGPA